MFTNLHEVNVQSKHRLYGVVQISTHPAPLEGSPAPEAATFNSSLFSLATTFIFLHNLLTLLFLGLSALAGPADFLPGERGSGSLPQPPAPSPPTLLTDKQVSRCRGVTREPLPRAPPHPSEGGLTPDPPLRGEAQKPKEVQWPLHRH